MTIKEKKANRTIMILSIKMLSSKEMTKIASKIKSVGKLFSLIHSKIGAFGKSLSVIQTGNERSIPTTKKIATVFLTSFSR
jgi:hypothetical protein